MIIILLVAMALQAAEPEESPTHKTLAALNAEYEAKFGFIFMCFVNGRTLEQIIPVLRERMVLSREEELATGLKAFVDVARSRLSKLSPP